MEHVRFLPWAPDDCDAALLAGRALTRSRRGAPSRSRSPTWPLHLDTRAAGAARAGRRRRSRSGVRGSSRVRGLAAGVPDAAERSDTIGLVADRLSSLDTSFLHLEDAATPMHVGSVMVFDAPDRGASTTRAS